MHGSQDIKIIGLSLSWIGTRTRNWQW